MKRDRHARGVELIIHEANFHSRHKSNPKHLLSQNNKVLSMSFSQFLEGSPTDAFWLNTRPWKTLFYTVALFLSNTFTFFKNYIRLCRFTLRQIITLPFSFLSLFEWLLSRFKLVCHKHWSSFYILSSIFILDEQLWSVFAKWWIETIHKSAHSIPTPCIITPGRPLVSCQLVER